MWNWFNCYFSGRHEFGVWCEPGSIFLRCVHCGRRSSGWAIEHQAREAQPPVVTRTPPAPAPTVPPLGALGRVVPFGRAALR